MKFPPSSDPFDDTLSSPGSFREPQAVLWVEKSQANFGQAEQTASMPDTIQTFSDQVSLSKDSQSTVLPCL